MEDGASTQQSDPNEQDVVDLVDETPGAPSTASDPHPSPPSNGSMEALVHFLRKSRNEDRDLPTFSGDILDWPTFIQKYHGTTEEFNISDDANMKRLDGALRGEAREAAVGLLRNPCFVKDIIRILERKYGGAENATAAAMETVENMKPLNPDLRNLVEFTRNALKVHRMITQCGITSVAQGTLRRIEKLIPVTQVQLWNMHQIIIGKPNGGSLDDLVSWLTDIKVPKKLKVYHKDDEAPRSTYRRRSSPYKERRWETDRQGHHKRPYYNHNGEDRGTDKYKRIYQKETTPDTRNDQGSHEHSKRDRSNPQRVMVQQGATSADNDPCDLQCGSKNSHAFDQCEIFKNFTQPERFQAIKRSRRCAFCCGKHNFVNCTARQQ